MRLNQISDNPGSRTSKTRRGRGSSSGLGKTSGHGVKGQLARAGVSIHGFEGGQMPLYMRIPKRGFFNHFANDFAEINLGRLQWAIDGGKLKTDGTITDADLHQAGLVRHSRDGVRVLAKGELKAKVNLKVAGASASAIEAVKKAGGSLATTFKKKIHMDKKGKPGKRRQRQAAAAEKHAKKQPG
jgi:large subunit ribosomal protein L15